MKSKFQQEAQIVLKVLSIKEYKKPGGCASHRATNLCLFFVFQAVPECGERLVGRRRLFHTAWRRFAK